MGTKDTTATVSSALKTADSAFTKASTAKDTAVTAVATAEKALADAKLPAGAWGKLIKAVADAEKLVVTSLAVKAIADARGKLEKASLKADTDAKALDKAVAASKVTLATLLKKEGEYAEALSAATTAHTNAETKAKTVVSDLYCLLGDHPKDKAGTATDTAGGNNAKDWYKLATGGSALTAVPDFCTVADGTKYYNAKAKLAAENTAAKTLWTLTLQKTEAAAKLTTTTKHTLTTATKVVTSTPGLASAAAGTSL